MDGKDPQAVVEADQRIDGALRKEQPPKRRAAVVDGEAGRQHEPEAAVRAGERDGPLDEQLIAVDMAVGLGSA